MDRPAGAAFIFDAVFGSSRLDSEGFVPSGPSPLADFCRRDSMMERCWSRTATLRCSCSRMAGSWVWKPGDRHARPTSWTARLPSRAVCGARGAAVVAERSNFRGRCLVLELVVVLVVVSVAEPRSPGDDGGSFFTDTLDADL